MLPYRRFLSRVLRGVSRRHVPQRPAPVGNPSCFRTAGTLPLDFVRVADCSRDCTPALHAVWLLCARTRQGCRDYDAAEEFGQLASWPPLRADGALGIQEMRGVGDVHDGCFSGCSAALERESYAAESGCPRAVAPVRDAKAYKPRPCSLTSSSRTWLVGERDDASRSLPLFPACPRRVAHASRPVGRPKILRRPGTRARLLTLGSSSQRESVRRAFRSRSATSRCDQRQAIWRTPLGSRCPVQHVQVPVAKWGKVAQP